MSKSLISVKAYLGNYGACPTCHTEKVEQSYDDFLFVGDGIVEFPVLCNACGKEWFVQYKLYRIVE